jgi:GT2 family glycosyltransferase
MRRRAIASQRSAAAAAAELLQNSSNLGIAAALNRGFGELEQLGCVWAVAFDQDSIPEPGLVGSLMNCARRLSAARPPAVIGANWRDEARPNQPSLHLRPHPAFPWLFQRVPAVEGPRPVSPV